MEEKIVFGPDIETFGETSLNPFKAKIISIQLRVNGRNHIWKEWERGEKNMLLDFLDFWSELPRSKKRNGITFVGYNILKFDIPFILVRASCLDLEKYGWSLERLWNDFVHGPCYVDLYQLLGDNFKKFKMWKKYLVGAYSKYSNKDIKKFYQNKEFGKIEEYINDELVSLEKIYKAIKKEKFYKELKKLARIV